jgi:Ferritin-like
MLKIDPNIIRGVLACRSKEELRYYLQRAVELEHATIPPYLTAMYSLIPGKNDEIAALIRSIVIEEMLHMTIAANVLVAIGGCPQINHQGFIPTYPGPLPMGIGHDLVVPIKPFSKALVWDVFMRIEEPEHPIPVEPPEALAAEPEYATIGQFYAAIRKKIGELGDAIFVVGPERQVLSWFDSELLFPIVDVKSADRAIRIIVTQGEGTRSDPFESPDEPAHFYRFGETYWGRKIIEVAGRFAYAGDPVPFDEGGVYPMIDNPSPSDYPPGSHVAMLSDTFSYGYSTLLNALHQAFNGSPRAIDAAIGMMYQLRLQAQTLMTTPVRPGSERTAGPVYRYVASE